MQTIAYDAASSGSAGASTSEASRRAHALRLMTLHGFDLQRMAQLLIGAEVLARVVVVSVIGTASGQAAAQGRASQTEAETETETRRVLARLVFDACWTEPGGALTPTESNPRSQVLQAPDLANEFGRWISTTSQYQRAALALYLYGCHSATQAGIVLNLPLYAVHRLIAGALLELASRLPSD